MFLDTLNPTDHGNYRISKYREEHKQLCLVEWLGGFAQGELDPTTMVWNFVLYEPEQFPLPDNNPLTGITSLTYHVMDREGDAALVHQIMEARIHLHKRRIRA